MGYGEDAAGWNHTQEATVQEILDSGLMKFYYPPAVEMQIRPHEWSFMRPVGRLTTSAENRVYTMPEDFERFDGDLTYASDDEHYPPIQIVPEQRLRQLDYQSDYTSHPQYAAVRPVAADGTGWQRQELILHPTPDSEYTLNYRYHAMPVRLSETVTYPLGGPMFAEAVKASCLAEAELIRDGKAGAMRAVFLDSIATAIAADLRRGPDLLGYNADASTLSGREGANALRRVRDYLWTNVTYNGS